MWLSSSLANSCICTGIDNNRSLLFFCLFSNEHLNYNWIKPTKQLFSSKVQLIQMKDAWKTFWLTIVARDDRQPKLTSGSQQILIKKMLVQYVQL